MEFFSRNNWVTLSLIFLLTCPALAALTIESRSVSLIEIISTVGHKVLETVQGLEILVCQQTRVDVALGLRTGERESLAVETKRQRFEYSAFYFASEIAPVKFLETRNVNYFLPLQNLIVCLKSAANVLNFCNLFKLNPNNFSSCNNHLNSEVPQFSWAKLFAVIQLKGRPRFPDPVLLQLPRLEDLLVTR